MRTEDPGILHAALVGYGQQLAEITVKIANLRKRLGQRAPSAARGAARAARPQKKHFISAEGRARIAQAQKRRWAAAKKAPKVRTAGAE